MNKKHIDGYTPLDTHSKKMEHTKRRCLTGYTLVELIVAVGVFALIMTLATGAYLVMINVSRQTQAVSIGIDNLAFALETMTRTIRTGTSYSCLGQGDCAGGNSFAVRGPSGTTITFSRLGSTIIQTPQGGSATTLTDPSVTVTSLVFYVDGTSSADDFQPKVIITAAGTVSAGPNKTIPFNVETAAVMRGSDI